MERKRKGKEKGKRKGMGRKKEGGRGKGEVWVNVVDLGNYVTMIFTPSSLGEE